jgi:hypothetical protein
LVCSWNGIQGSFSGLMSNVSRAAVEMAGAVGLVLLIAVEYYEINSPGSWNFNNFPAIAIWGQVSYHVTCSPTICMVHVHRDSSLLRLVAGLTWCCAWQSFKTYYLAVSQHYVVLCSVSYRSHQEWPKPDRLEWQSMSSISICLAQLQQRYRGR